MSNYGETILTLNSTTFGIAPYSARGLKQTLEIIPAASYLRRTVNGNLRDFSYSQFRKYRSVISATDQDPPDFDLLFPGAQLEVWCAAEIGYLTHTAYVTGRSVVPGSTPRVEGSFTFYRPVLQMLVVSFTEDADEWNQEYTWQLHLEEI